MGNIAFRHPPITDDGYNYTSCFSACVPSQSSMNTTGVLGVVAGINASITTDLIRRIFGITDYSSCDTDYCAVFPRACDVKAMKTCKLGVRDAALARVLGVPSYTDVGGPFRACESSCLRCDATMRSMTNCTSDFVFYTSDTWTGQVFGRASYNETSCSSEEACKALDTRCDSTLAGPHRCMVGFEIAGNSDKPVSILSENSTCYSACYNCSEGDKKIGFCTKDYSIVSRTYNEFYDGVYGVKTCVGNNCNAPQACGAEVPKVQKSDRKLFDSFETIEILIVALGGGSVVVGAGIAGWVVLRRTQRHRMSDSGSPKSTKLRF